MQASSWRVLLGVLAAVLPGPVARTLLRMVLKYRIARGVRIGFGTVIIASEVNLEQGVRIGRFCRIKAHRIDLDKSARVGHRVRISVRTVHLHARSILGDAVTISGNTEDPRSILTMGMHSWIFQECYVDATRHVQLGKNVGIGGRSEVFTHGYWLSALEGYPVAKEAVSFGDDVWIPWSCFIMPGAHLGSGVVIGARSVVSGDVPDGVLAAGAPARVIRESARRPMPVTAQIRILREITQDLASSMGDLFEERAGPDGIDLIIGGNKYLRLMQGPQSVMSSDCLNVLMGSSRAREHERAQWWSVSTSLSSPDAGFTDRTRRWLDHARGWGVRFYPEDEISRYSGSWGSLDAEPETRK